MAYILDQSHETSNGAAALGSAVYRLASTFQAGVTEDLTRVELLMYREGTPPNVTLEIHGVDGSDKPDNSSLASVSVDISGITTNTVGEWVAFDFPTPASLTSGVKYALVVGDGWTDASNRFRWLQQTGADNYANGSKHYATDGTSWIQSNYDMDFRTYYGSTDISLAGSITAISLVTGKFYAPIEIAGSLNSSSNAVGGLLVTTSLEGSAVGVSGTADFLILNAVKFSGVVSAVCSTIGYAICTWRLFGTIDANSSFNIYTLDLYPDFEATTLFWRPQANIIETLEWKTSVLKSHNGTEQRIKIRQSPRQHFRYQILLDSNKLNTWMDSQVHGWLKLKWLVPIWTEYVEHTVDINHRDITIIVDTTVADFRDGGKAIVWKSSTEYEVVKILTVQDNQLTLNPNYGMLASFTGAKYIMPVREAYMTMSVTKDRYNSEIGLATMVFKIHDNTNMTGWVPVANYDGMPVLNAPAFMERTHIEGSNPNNKVLDYQTGTFEIVNHEDFNYTTQAHKFYNDTKIDCWNFRKFLYSLNGKQKSILIPTFRSDFVQSGTIVSGQTYVDIEKINLADNMGFNNMRTYIGFYFPLTGRLIVRKITDIALVGPSLHATLERITFNTDLGYADIITTNNCQIGFVDKCRLESDKVEINWEWTDKSVCDTKFARII